MKNGKKKIGRFATGMIISVVGTLCTLGSLLIDTVDILSLGIALQIASYFVCETIEQAIQYPFGIGASILMVPVPGINLLLALFVVIPLFYVLVFASPIANVVIYCCQGRVTEGFKLNKMRKKQEEELQEMLMNQTPYKMAQGMPMDNTPYGMAQGTSMNNTPYGMAQGMSMNNTPYGMAQGMSMNNTPYGMAQGMPMNNTSYGMVQGISLDSMSYEEI